MRALHRSASALYFALVVLVVAWEAWGAPSTLLPRGFWIGLKLVPLLLPLPWLLKGSAYAHVLAALLLMLYFSEGVATLYHATRSSATGPAVYAATQASLALAFIALAPFYARLKFRADVFRGLAEKES